MSHSYSLPWLFVGQPNIPTDQPFIKMRHAEHTAVEGSLQLCKRWPFSGFHLYVT